MLARKLPTRLLPPSPKVRCIASTLRVSLSAYCSAGGKAVSNTSSVADGADVIQTALDAFGGITILINNAGILRLDYDHHKLLFEADRHDVPTVIKGIIARDMLIYINCIVPCSFKNLTDQEWDIIQLVHLKGAFSCSKAAWPYFRKQNFGRIINTASAAGLYGTHPGFDIVCPNDLFHR
jgi:multifunctional beta-oxidation protein